MAKTKTQNILDLIETDHRNVEQLFAEFENTKAAKKSQEIFNQIYQELELHAKAEELVFYPAMQEFDDTQQYVEEAEKEHVSAELLLEQMKKMKPGEAEFKNKMQALKKAVMHHVEEEESEIFPAVQDCMNEKDLQNLGQEFQAAKTRLEPKIKAALA
jgi:hemerythrin superfamily protein